MKTAYNTSTPTHKSLMAMFRRQPNTWVSYEAVYQHGGTNASGRISELRSTGEQIEHRGTGKTSEYRWVPKAGSPDAYDQFACECGFSGTEPQMMRGLDGSTMLCPRCGLVTRQVA